jgi:hypothetical protein
MRDTGKMPMLLLAQRCSTRRGCVTSLLLTFYCSLLTSRGPSRHGVPALNFRRRQGHRRRLACAWSRPRASFGDVPGVRAGSASFQLPTHQEKSARKLLSISRRVHERCGHVVRTALWSSTFRCLRKSGRFRPFVRDSRQPSNSQKNFRKAPAE